MARKKGLAPASPVVTRARTGLFWPCQSNIIPGAHPVGPVANSIRLDKNGHCYVRCAGCNDQHFFSRELWTPQHGMTLDQCRQAGLTVLA